MRDDDLELYAINTGEFYGKHVRLATEHCHIDKWLDHVLLTVAPRYQREIEPRKISDKEMVATAQGLRDYYEQHIKEF